MSLDGADAENMVLGERTRELLRAFSDFVDMLSVDAPTPVLARQMDELERLAREIDQLAGAGLQENGAWAVIGNMGKLMRIAEVMQYRDRQAQEPTA